MEKRKRLFTDPVEETQLCRAAAFGDVKLVKHLIKHGLDVNSQDNLTGNTPLIWSIINSKFQMTKLLIKMGADIHLESFNNKTAFDWALKSNNAKAMPILVKNTRNSRHSTGQLLDRVSGWKVIPAFIKKLSIKDEKDKCTPEILLHNAATEGANQSVKELLKKGVQINSKNDHGETALHSAIRKQRHSTVKLLLSNGADVNSQDIDGATPIHTAVAFNDGHKCDDIIRTIIKSNANLYKENIVGETALKYAFSQNDMRTAKIVIKALSENCPFALEALNLAIAYEKIDIINLIFKRWPNAGEWKDENGNTPLHTAILKERYDSVSEIVSRVNINEANDDGDTALHLAVERKLNQVVCLLLHNDVDLNVQNSQGDTALHLAVESNLLIFILLVDKCNRTIQNSDGNTAFHLAARYGKSEFIDLMINEGKQKSLEDLSTIDYSKSYEFRNLQNNRKFTALHYACAENNYKIVERLLEIDVNTELQNSDGKTALDIAIEMNHFCLVSLFSGPKLCGSSLALFVCQICKDIPIAPNVVYQCENEHIYCGTCDANEKVKVCPKCRVPIKLKIRNKEFENKLAIMFPNADLENCCSDSFECLFEY